MKEKLNDDVSNVIEAIAVVTAETNALAIRAGDRDALVETLTPIAAVIAPADEYAKSLVVKNESDAKAAAIKREQILAFAELAIKSLREFDNNLMARLFQTHRRWTWLEGQFSDSLAASAKTIKTKVIEWQRAEQEKAEKESARLQAEAEAKAAAERERLRKAAEKLKTPELKEQRLAEAENVIAPMVVVQPPAKAVKVQLRWTVQSIDKAAFVKAAAENPQLQGYITINEAALARGKASNSMMEIPGCVFAKVAV